MVCCMQISVLPPQGGKVKCYFVKLMYSIGGYAFLAQNLEVFSGKMRMIPFCEGVRLLFRILYWLLPKQVISISLSFISK